MPDLARLRRRGGVGGGVLGSALGAIVRTCQTYILRRRKRRKTRVCCAYEHETQTSQFQGATISMTLKKNTQRLAQQLFGAIAFYTTIPISARWTLDFTRIASWSPLVGLLLGFSLAVSDVLLQPLFPTPLRSALVILIWIGITGALHLDGAMDTADGLGVWDLQKRLEVMADSRSGAFGVIAAIAIITLKLFALDGLLFPALACTAVDTRVGTMCPCHSRLDRYPYLKSHGKARLHHDAFQRGWDMPSRVGSDQILVD